MPAYMTIGQSIRTKPLRVMTASGIGGLGEDTPQEASSRAQVEKWQQQDCQEALKALKEKGITSGVYWELINNKLQRLMGDHAMPGTSTGGSSTVSVQAPDYAGGARIPGETDVKYQERLNRLQKARATEESNRRKEVAFDLQEIIRKALLQKADEEREQKAREINRQIQQEAAAKKAKAPVLLPTQPLLPAFPWSKWDAKQPGAGIIKQIQPAPPVKVTATTRK